MDVELQIIKHLARDAQSTVSVIDDYCAIYKDLFSDVRNYECFKYLHLGIISPIKRKSLPEIAKVVGIKSPQSLHHFIANSPWSEVELRNTRLKKTLKALRGNTITLVIDETGDRKKGKKTDYVARQYLGSVLKDTATHIGKIDNGIVSVNAYGIYNNITFPLIFKVFKPKGTLKENDTYKTKIELASEIVTELINWGFKIELVLADSLYGEASSFIRTLEQFKLRWLLAIRSNLKKVLGNLYGLRTWVEYGFRQCKQELGWTDYRFTNFQDINKWWEIIMSAYLMVSLSTQSFLSLGISDTVDSIDEISIIDFSAHPQWNHQIGWKNVLNNLRLIIQPTLLLWLVFPWLDVLPNSSLLHGFHCLIDAMNQFQPFYLSG
jgi:SRSO17 transposase